MKHWWIILILPFWLGATGLRAEYFVISLFKVEVNITPEGYADFHETITVEFSQPRHGIFRFIPYRNVVKGKETDFIFEKFRVEGYKFSTSKENGNHVLKIGDKDTYVEGKQVYHIYYRVANPIVFFDDHSQFYWDLLGISWPVETGSFNFEVTVPDKVFLKQEDVLWYTGAEGMQGQDGRVNIFPKKINGHTTRVFQPGEGFTVALKFPKGAFAEMDSWNMFLKKHKLLFAPIFFLLAGVVAKVFSRNKRQTIMTEYYPPEGVSPAIAGGFVDHSVDNNDVLCLIPHLANQGYLKLETREGKGLFNKDEIIFTRLKQPEPGLFGFERDFLNGLFSYGDVVELRDLRDKFYTTMASVKTSVKSWITSQGWYERDQRTMGCITAVLGLLAIAWGAYATFGRQNIDGLALILTGLILFFIASRFNKRSPLGNETFRKFEGFRQFVAKAEKPIIERLLKDDPHYYDKTMAFALAFGYLKQWNRQFDGLLTQPPSWYSGPMMYGTSSMDSWTNFANNFPSEVNNIGSVFSSAPSSSGSGGGGGGFSGGGGGGGGGGSW